MIPPDDQEQTHQLLKNGEVFAYISTKERPLQGCICEYLGSMDYTMLASTQFVTTWFPNGFTVESATAAPAVICNRKD